MPRLPPLPPERTPALKAQFDSFFKSLGFVPNSAPAMAPMRPQPTTQPMPVERMLVG